MSALKYISGINQLVQIPDIIMGNYEFDTILGFRQKFMERLAILKLLTHINNQRLTCQQFQKTNEFEKHKIYRDWTGPSQKKRKTYSNCKEAVWANLGNNNR
jgi:hypothetical protein